MAADRCHLVQTGRFLQPHWWREVDFLFVLDGRVHPVEVKKGVTVRRDWAGLFHPADRLGLPRRSGAVVCLCGEPLPVASDVQAVPVGLL